jgi:hypothetical protein
MFKMLILRPFLASLFVIDVLAIFYLLSGGKVLGAVALCGGIALLRALWRKL